MSLPTQHLVILTGASRGMGLAMARHLLAPDCLLLCLARHTAAELDVQARLRGATVLQWQQDLSKPNEAAARLDTWLNAWQDAQRFAGLASATLINNAGLIPRIGPIDQCPDHELASALRVGLEAPMLLSAAFLRATRQWVTAGWHGPRKVLNISSGLGRRPMAGQAPYCAAKAGLDHFTRCSALDEAQREHGARLVSLAPGVIDTDMQAHLRSGNPAGFPDLQRFVELQRQDRLTSPPAAAARVLAWLQRPDFGDQPVADVRD